MRKVGNLRDLVDVIRRSRLLDDQRLSDALRTLRSDGEGPPSADSALAQLVDAKILTNFQAEQLAVGKWKGFSIGSYRLLDRIGSGGMGRVYLAEHSVLGKRVAIKVLEGKLAGDPVARQRFMLEARASASLDHPNIVHMIDVETEANPPYLVMEFVEGSTLQASVSKCGPFLPGAAACCALQVAHGLQAAYEVGLVHRDIKPANLLLGKTGNVKILDLGIVRMEGESVTEEIDAKPILGTADYLSPEQAVDSSNVDIRADLYSLGSTLYFLLSGHAPYPDGSPALKLARKQIADPPWIGRLRPDVPETLAAIVHKLMARNPADRYPTPALAAEALKPWAKPEAGFPTDLLDGKPTGVTLAAPPAVGERTGPTRSNGWTVPAPIQPPPVNPIGPGSGGSISTWAPVVPPGGPGSAPTPLALHAVGSGRLNGSGPSLGGNSDVSTLELALPAGYAEPRYAPVPEPATDFDEDGEPETRAVAADGYGALWLATGIVALALVAVAVAGFFVLGSRPTADATPTAQTPATRPAPSLGLVPPRNTIVVTKEASRHPNVCATVAEAIQKANPGQRIEIWEETWTESVTGTSALMTNLTIAGRFPEKPVVWKPLATAAAVTIKIPQQFPGAQPITVTGPPPALSLTDGNNLTLENIVFEGGDAVPVLASIGGSGLGANNVTFQGFTHLGLTVPTGSAAAGNGVQPIAINRCRFLTNSPNNGLRAGMRIYSAVPVRVANCRFEGQLTVGIGVHARTPKLEVLGNRFHQIGQGVFFGTEALAGVASPADREQSAPGIECTVARNVFADGSLGLMFANAPSVPADRFHLGPNLFASESVLSSISGVNYFNHTARNSLAWVWSGNPDADDAKPTRYFRAKFEVPPLQAGRPVRVALDIGCSGSYSVWLNGKPIAEGRKPGLVVEAVDLAPALQPGQANVLAVQVTHGPELEGDNYTLKPGWVGRVRAAWDPTPLVPTQAAKGWKVADSVPDPNWTSPDFDDAKWEDLAVAKPGIRTINGQKYAVPGYFPPSLSWMSQLEAANPTAMHTFRIAAGNVSALPPLVPVPGAVPKVPYFHMMEGLPGMAATRMRLVVPRDPADDKTFLRPADADLPPDLRATFGFAND